MRLRKNEKLSSLLKAFRNNIGADGTIFSPSASMNLCNTHDPYDKLLTPSDNMGAFAEYVRIYPGSKRSSHPFWSISSIGPESVVLNKLSKHAFGVGSVWSHLLDLEATQINFGIHPSKAVTLIHHIETIVGVPYRYTKEFLHPIVTDDKIVYENYYQSVFYLDSDIKKRTLLNEHYFEKMQSLGLLTHAVHKQSNLDFWSFKMKDFYDIVLDFFIKDIYNYLEYEPSKKPWKKL